MIERRSTYLMGVNAAAQRTDASLVRVGRRPRAPAVRESRAAAASETFELRVVRRPDAMRARTPCGVPRAGRRAAIQRTRGPGRLSAGARLDDVVFFVGVVVLDLRVV